MPRQLIKVRWVIANLRRPKILDLVAVGAWHDPAADPVFAIGKRDRGQLDSSTFNLGRERGRVEFGHLHISIAARRTVYRRGSEGE